MEVFIMKKNKSVWAFLLIVSLAFSCAVMGCPTDAPEDQVLKAGTYTADATGMHGPVTVEVTFSDSAITAVEVKANTESAIQGGAAINSIPAAIVEYQSLAVDTVSGATVTSNAILKAVEDCIKQAGGDPAKWRTPVEKPGEDPGDRTAIVDVLVIGGGGTGLAAAMSAITNGAEKVMLVEKMGYFGGSTANSGAVVLAEGTYYTDSIGLAANHDAWEDSWRTASEHEKDVYGKLDLPYPTYSRVRQYFTQVGQAVNWLQDLDVATWVSYPFIPNSTYQVPDYIITDGNADAEGGYMLTDKMVDWLEKEEGADLRLNTKGISLITNESGDVIGAKVQDNVGTYDVYAERGVVLATGGFAASEEMMRQYLPQFVDWIDLTTSSHGNTGDGMNMAVELGGVRYEDPFVITLGSCSRYSNLNAFCMSVNLWARMVVNSQAQRFFNEGVMPYEATVALSRTEDGISWALGDSNLWLVDLLEEHVDGVEVVKADTVQELATKMGVDPDALQASITRYNGFCENQLDEDFDKSPMGFAGSNLVPIAQAPYYAVRIYVCTGGTIGGVKTNGDYQVLRGNGSIIKGLYAGGETSNREMYAYAYSSGSGVGYALASGRQIGINIMK
jgi:fumarate reductase flavoprotein subunit